jgi:prevent-host-death family protein
MHIAVRELKDRLSELLRCAEAGEEIVVTAHGKPVARLGPIERPTAADPVEALRRLRSQSWLRAGDGESIRAVAEPVPAAPAGEPLLSALLLVAARGATVIVDLDTSALAKLFTSEPGSGSVAEALGSAVAVATHRIVYVDMHATFGRALRMGRIEAASLERRLREFEDRRSALDVVEATDALIRRAAGLAVQYGTHLKSAFRGATVMGALAIPLTGAHGCQPAQPPLYRAQFRHCSAVARLLA